MISCPPVVFAVRLVTAIVRRLVMGKSGGNAFVPVKFVMSNVVPAEVPTSNENRPIGIVEAKATLEKLPPTIRTTTNESNLGTILFILSPEIRRSWTGHRS
jgi:hypothetical protein